MSLGGGELTRPAVSLFCVFAVTAADTSQVRFGQVKRKLGISSTAETPTPSAKASGKKRENSAAATPTKVAKNTGRVGGKGRGRGKVKSEPAVEEDEADRGDEPLIKDEPVGSVERFGDEPKEEFFDPPSQFEEEMRALGQQDESV